MVVISSMPNLSKESGRFAVFFVNRTQNSFSLEVDGENCSELIPSHSALRRILERVINRDKKCFQKVKM